MDAELLRAITRAAKAVTPKPLPRSEYIRIVLAKSLGLNPTRSETRGRPRSKRKPNAKKAARLAKVKDTPPMRQLQSELLSAGWICMRGVLWKAPQGGYLYGPHGAWLAMKRQEDLSGIKKVP